MSTNDRDTHFQGFARRLWIELLAHSTFERKSMHSPEYGAEMEQIIAQRAYDLVGHVLKNLWLDAREGSDYLRELMQDTPDLTAWPKPD